MYKGTDINQNQVHNDDETITILKIYHLLSIIVLAMILLYEYNRVLPMKETFYQHILEVSWSTGETLKYCFLSTYKVR